MSEMDAEFNSLVEQINQQIKAAAEALNKANELASKAGFDGLIFTQWMGDDMRQKNRYADTPLDKYELQDKIDETQSRFELIKVRELESAINNAGWSTSSAYC